MKEGGIQATPLLPSKNHKKGKGLFESQYVTYRKESILLTLCQCVLVKIPRLWSCEKPNTSWELQSKFRALSTASNQFPHLTRVRKRTERGYQTTK